MNVIAPYILQFLPVFLLSLITYKMREEVFRSWLRFAYWWVPLSILLILSLSGSGIGNMGYLGPVIDQEGAAIGLSSLFFFISLAIIAWKSWKLRKRQ